MQLSEDEVKRIITQATGSLPDPLGDDVKIARAIEAALRAQADARPVAWLHEIVEPDQKRMHMYSDSEMNPWSHWLTSYRGKCEYKRTPLYTHPETSAQPMCVKCGDGIMAHDPGTCGNCHAMGAEASAPGLGDAPRYAEWRHLGDHGQWSDGVPAWARDHEGRMNDVTAMRAVIEELSTLLTRASAATAKE